MKLFAGYIKASRLDGISLQSISAPFCCAAASEDVATAIVLENCRKTYPSSAGWSDHIGDVVEVPDATVLRVAQSIEARKHDQ